MQWVKVFRTFIIFCEFFFVVDDVFLFVFLIQHVDMSQKNKYSSLLSLFTVRGD